MYINLDLETTRNAALEVDMKNRYDASERNMLTSDGVSFDTVFIVFDCVILFRDIFVEDWLSIMCFCLINFLGVHICYSQQGLWCP